MSFKKNKRILFIADHASNYIPNSLKNLGLKENQLNSHIAYDLGVKELCINLSNLFNSKYILEMINNLEDETVILEFKNSASPVIAKEESNPNLIYVLMPMRV